MSNLLTEKYKPKSATELLQKSAVIALKDFVMTYSQQKKKAVLIYGGPGTGKTSSVHVLANELGLELIELNASDLRNSDQIQTILGSSIKQKSLFYTGKLILVDEIDGITGNEDRGGVSAISQIIEESPQPIVLTANNPWNSKLASLRNKSLLIEFKSLNYLSIFNFLKLVCEQEKIKYDSDSLKSLARRSGGDLRSALNDLQSIIKKGISKEAIELISERNRINSILSALTKIFKSSDAGLAVTAFEDIEEDLDLCFLWLEENMPKEYSGKSLANGFNMLSKADTYRKKIIRTQYWRFLSYVNTFLTAGITLAKEQGVKKGFVMYSRSSRLLKLWQARQTKGKKQFFEKLSKHTHCSSSKSSKNIFPYLQFILKKNNKSADFIENELRLQDDETEFLRARI